MGTFVMSSGSKARGRKKVTQRNKAKSKIEDIEVNKERSEWVVRLQDTNLKKQEKPGMKI